MTNNIERNQPPTPSSLLQWWTQYAVKYNLYSWRWAYRCLKHVEILMIINHNYYIMLVPLVIGLAVTTIAITVLRNLPTGRSRAALWYFSVCKGIALEISLRWRKKIDYSLFNFWSPYLWQKQWSLQYCQTPIVLMKVCEKKFPLTKCFDLLPPSI